jgi:hypothetical protein
MESLVLSVKGLYTNSNEASAVPLGALSRGDNVVVNKDGLAEPRRGFDRLAFSLPLSTDRAIKLLQYQNTLLVHYRTTQLGHYSDTSGVVPYIGSYSSPDPKLALIKSAEANQNLYLTSTKGIQKIDKVTSNPYQAGMFKGLDINASASASVSGFMSNNAQVAYRLIWGITDANNNLVRGFPSQRAVISNTSGSVQNVSVVSTVPAGVTVNNFYQLYRGNQSPSALTNATGTIQDLSFAAVVGGTPGNAVTVSYTNGGSIVVSVIGNAVSVQIVSGTSTAAQVLAAINASAAALAVISASLTGAANAAQTAPATITLSGGTITLVTPDDNMQLVFEGSTTGSTLSTLGANTDITYTSVLSGLLGDTVHVSYITGGTAGAEVVTALPSTLVFQDITYTSVALGGPGNLANITYTSGGVAGAEVVTVYGNSIRVQIASGVSTATQVLAAINASPGALNVVSALITGTPANPQTAAGPTSLSGGTVQIQIQSGVSTATQVLAALKASVNGSSIVSAIISGVGSNTQTAPVSPTALSGGLATVTILDQTPDSLRGAALYTDQTQDGILQSNELPPYANDVAVFRNCLFFGNTRTKQVLPFTILAVGGSLGLQSGDTITIAGTTYTAGGSEILTGAGSPQFQVFTGGSAAQNINDTALSLVRVINRCTANSSVYAFYVSSPSGLPGQIQIEERILGGAAYNITVSAHRTAYSPTMPTLATDPPVVSTNQVNLNGLMYSKQQQPDAVPSVNILFVGSASARILRILALRDALFILKEDGIFRCSGADPTTFAIDLVDNTAILLAPESAVTLSNQIYALTTQGVVAISDTGVEVVSRQIENQILSLFGNALQPLRDHSFGIGYESDREYILWTVSDAVDTVANQAFVYNIFTKAWTRWTRTQGPGLILMADNRMYVSDPLSNFINQERKTGDYTDYIDEALPVTIISASNFVVTVNDSSFAAIGDLLFQSNNVASLITAVDVANGLITVADNLPWDPLSPAFVCKAISTLVEWTPNAANGQPGYSKQWAEAALQFKQNGFYNSSFNFYSEISTGVDFVPVTGSGNGTWGKFLWGLVSWGGISPRRQIRTYIPLEKQRCGLLSVQFACKEAWATFALEGVALSFRYVSTRTSN